MSWNGFDGGKSVKAARLFRAALACVLLLTGCLSLEVPEKFLVVRQGSNEIKAMTPQEGKLWVREFGDRFGGDFDFWSEALRNDLVKNRGYTLIEERKVQDRKAREGLELLFEVAAQGVAQRYLITLFVLEGGTFTSGNRIRVAEFVAPRAVFEAHADDVRKAITTLGP